MSTPTPGAGVSRAAARADPRRRDRRLPRRGRAGGGARGARRPGPGRRTTAPPTAAVDADRPARRVADAAGPAVARPDGGPSGAVAPRPPGRRPAGVRVERDGTVEIAVVLPLRRRGAAGCAVAAVGATASDVGGPDPGGAGVAP